MAKMQTVITLGIRMALFVITVALLMPAAAASIEEPPDPALPETTFCEMAALIEQQTQAIIIAGGLILGAVIGLAVIMEMRKW